MALARLRRILQSQYAVRLRSDQRLLNRVNAKIVRRAQKFTAKGQTAPSTKTPQTVASVEAQAQWQIRAIDLLHKIGSLTTPTWVNLAQLSASWAIRRYFWAIADGNGALQNFRLSEDARLLDFHQKTLLSDEFGMGMAGLLLEQLFNAPSFVDVSVALNDPSVYQNVQQTAEAQPDYLMWGSDPQSPYYVVECKGCQTNSSTSMDQLRRGMEQVPSLVLGAGTRPIVTLVVATFMANERTTVYVLDPPSDDPSDSYPPRPPQTEKVSERIGERSWRITNPVEFEKRIQLSKESELLKWAGQFNNALGRDTYLTRRETLPTMQDFELDTRKTNIATYKGCWWPLFSELGYQKLRLFTGVEEELLARVTEASPEMHAASKTIQDRVAERGLHQELPYESLSRNGTCMIVEGVD
jgi:hypothetical protein